MSHLPPQSLEDEEAVLGAMIQSRRALSVVLASGLTRDAFYRPSHAAIFDAIVDLAAMDAVDERTVIARLKANGMLDVAGGPVAIVGLVERTPTAANAAAYATEVMNVAGRRALVDAAHRIATIGYDPSVPFAEAVSAAEGLLYASMPNHTNRGGNGVSGADSVEAYRVAYTARRSEDGHPGWNLPLLSERIGFLRPGQVLIGAAQTSEGKSWLFNLACTEAVCEQGGNVLQCSTEMTSEELTDRLVAMGGFTADKIEMGDVEPSLFRHRLEQIAGWKRTVIAGTVTVAMIRSELTRARLGRTPFDVVVVDYLQDLDFDYRKGENRVTSVDRALTQLKLLALDMGVALILVSQLSRIQPRKIGDTMVEYPPPRLSDLRETGKLEQVGNHVVFLHRDRSGQRMTSSGRLIVAKSRSRDVTGSFRVEWNGTPQGDEPYRFVRVGKGATAEADLTMIPEAEQKPSSFYGNEVV